MINVPFLVSPLNGICTVKPPLSTAATSTQSPVLAQPTAIKARVKIFLSKLKNEEDMLHQEKESEQETEELENFNRSAPF
jgi:hypothetical protein